MADACDLAAYLKGRIVSARGANHQSMDAGQPQDIYLRLVGRQAQLRELETWLTEGLNKLKVEEDSDG